MHQVFLDDRLQVAPAEDEDPVQTFPAQGAHPALGVGVRSRGPEGGADDPDGERQFY